MPLNASKGRILNEIMNLELKDVGLDVPDSLRIGNGGRDQLNIVAIIMWWGMTLTIVLYFKNFIWLFVFFA